MSNLLFIDDFFLNQVVGGGELNNCELILLLQENSWNVLKVQSHLVQESHFNDIDVIVVSNFANLSENIKNKIINSKIPYVIYEHDHKYLQSRNPAQYKDFLAPKDKLINIDFYQNANRVFCQSQFHKTIIYKNLQIDNLENLSGNLWSLSDLNKFEKYSKVNKVEKASIMLSSIPHKNTSGAIYFCEKNKIQYNLIKPSTPDEFHKNISKNKLLVFFPKTPETLSRIVVEARMMNMSLKSNNLIGATKEPWFEKKGSELINYFFKKRLEILRMVENAF